MILLTGKLEGRYIRRMKRILFCFLVALSLGVLNSQAQDAAQKKDKPAEAKAASPAPPVAPPLPGATPAASPAPKTAPAKDVAVIKTSKGEMVVEFWSDVAPKHVENFKSLAKKGFYDGTAFHRVIKGFMIQGGDPLTKDAAQSSSWGTGSPGYTVKAEFNDKPHVRGVLSMARGGDPDSAGSQFFICLDRAASLDHLYTAFGKVIKGDDVLGKLGDAPVGPGNRGENSRPVERLAIESVKIVGIDTIK
jgi:peptidyl-prolyl cis-trans isomerase B (cyclophilin B)